MNKAIKIRSDGDFNCYSVEPRGCMAAMSRQQWNYSNRSTAVWKCGPASYWVTGFVNGVFTSLELHNYRDAKKLFLAMCKA